MKEKLKTKRALPWCALLAVFLLLAGVRMPQGLTGAPAGVQDVQAATQYFTVRFWDTDGESSYSSLRQKVASGTKITLPEVPDVLGYVNLGWSTKKNAQTAVYAEGKTITVKKNLKLYAVRKKTGTCSVYFYSNTGKTNSTYKKLNRKVTKSTYITLPSLPSRSGYQAVGWSTKKGASSAQYKEGKKLKITKSRKLYAVYKKIQYYKVYFYGADGSSLYQSSSVEGGKSLTLPSVPSKDGYTALGWSTVKNASTAQYKAGASYVVQKSVRFYPVYSEAVSVTLCKNNGALYKTVSVAKGQYLTLPSAGNASGYTFMGWDTQPGKSCGAQYQAGDKVLVNGAMTLYAVVFNRANEEDLTSANLMEASGWRLGNGSNRGYKQIIFVGDSRTVRMQYTLLRMDSSSGITRNIEFVAEEGKGLSWLKTDGYNALMEIVNNNNSVERPTAVVFNLGVNDLSNSSKYVTYLKELAATLKAKNCKLFLMSVNPVNSKMIEKVKPSAVRKESSVTAFNAALRSGLSQDYTYIDTYSWLMQTGFGTNAGGSGVDVALDDGLHYTTKTYKRIFKYCLDFLTNH